MTKQRAVPTLLVWMAAPNPYWVRRLQAIDSQGDFKLVCWFTDTHENDRDWVINGRSLTFDYKILPASAPRRLAFIVAGLFNARPSHLLTFHFQPVYWLALPMRLMGCKTAFYVEKTFDSWVRRTRLKELLKVLIFRCVSVIFVPGTDAMRYVQKYAPQAHFRRLDHEVDLGYLRQARSQRAAADRVRLLYLGRLVQGKGLPTLFAALRLANTDSITLDIVGSGPMENEVDLLCQRLGPWAKRHGFIQAEDLLSTFVAADVLIFPTEGDPYGLVVNEALAAGIAVISSDAAGEIRERLTDGPCSPRGKIFPSGDSNELGRLIDDTVVDRAGLNDLQAAAAEHADRNFGMNHWVSSIDSWVAGVNGRRF